MNIGQTGVIAACLSKSRALQKQVLIRLMLFTNCPPQVSAWWPDALADANPLGGTANPAEQKVAKQFCLSQAWHYKFVAIVFSRNESEELLGSATISQNFVRKSARLFASLVFKD